ncbi:hypothetical protein CN457_24375 [Bacillus cereus]|uniref:hypothetical protein n=1 Tax=Bacillus cereus TaxID=1396 RepID=UPI000BED855F|nr:hypothetical protein [Bacillus cereus]PEC89726.1 hypothetical protein CON02_19095 [Bacillus cereus]PEU51017.1 hypothetical protein CN414_26090 [Bacillus cereus]PEX76185.1 hypothetical protein CN457_24375 [Bacillus cereus]
MMEETKVQLRAEVSKLTDSVVKLEKEKNFHKDQYNKTMGELIKTERRRDKILTEYPNLFNLNGEKDEEVAY